MEQHIKKQLDEIRDTIIKTVPVDRINIIAMKKSQFDHRISAATIE